MGKFICQSGSMAGHEYPITLDKTTFGRLASCDVQIKDPKASREQFSIFKIGPLFFFSDAGSRNGTKLNEKKTKEKTLEYNDIIKVGDCEYLFVKEDGDKTLDDLLSKYKLDKKIGEGGMGLVYKATQVSMDREIALKILSPKHSSKQHFIDLFIKEARAAGALNHPNIIQVHDVGTENDVHYFSMEYIDGPTCSDLIKKSSGGLPVPLALDIVNQTAKALDYAHTENIIHRDIKPDNIMITVENVVKVADLGISKSKEEMEENQGKSIVGTPHYISPEVVKGDAVDHRIDLYSLGATFFHLLTGATPFKAATATDLLKAHAAEPVPNIINLRSDVPKPVQDLLYRLLEKNPDDRFQTANEVQTEIERIQKEHNLANSAAVGETVMLQDLATGKPEAKEELNDNSSALRKPPQSTTSSVTAQSIAAAEDKTKMIIMAAAGILVLVVILAIVFGDDSEVDPAVPTKPNNSVKQTAQVDDSSSSQQSPAAIINPPPTPPSSLDTLSEKRKKEKSEIAEVEKLGETLKAAKTMRDIQRVNKEAISLENKGLTRKATSSLNALRKKIESKRGLLQREQASIKGRELIAAIEEKEKKKEYSAAISQIENFIATYKDNTPLMVRGKLDNLKIQRGFYLSNLNRDFKRYEASNDIDGLRKLRKLVPPDSDLAKKIAKKLSEIRDGKHVERKKVYNKMLGQLSNWELLLVKETYEADKDMLLNTQEGKKARIILNSVNELQKVIDLINDEVTSKRYIYKKDLGRLSLTNLELKSATARGIEAKLDGGGETLFPWKEISEKQLQELVLTISGTFYKEYKQIMKNFHSLVD